MTPEQRIKVANFLLESDVGFEADCLFMPGQQSTTKEKEFAELILRLYTLFHPVSSCCAGHMNWEAENERLLKEIESPTQAEGGEKEPPGTQDQP